MNTKHDELPGILNEISDLEDNAVKEKTGVLKTVKYSLLVIAGAIYYICDGFNAGVSLSSILIAPAPLVLGVGIFFSLLAVSVFLGFSEREIARNLGVEKENAAELVDLCLSDLQIMKKITDKLNEKLDGIATTQVNFDIYTQYLQVLEQAAVVIDEKRTRIQESLNQPKIKIAKAVTAGVVGALFFSTGFFAGQSVATIITGLIVAGGVSAVAWPVIASGVLIGLAALSMYWFLERPGIQNLCARLFFKVDPEKVSHLCESNLLADSKKSIKDCQNKIIDKKLIQAQQQTISDLQQTKIESPKHKSLLFFAPEQETLVLGGEQWLTANINNLEHLHTSNVLH